MKGLICKHCGGNQFKETTKGYECEYCHAEFESGHHPEEKNKRKKYIISINLFVFFIMVLGSGLFFLNTNKEVKNPGTNLFSSVSKKQEYSTNQLNNPESNVQIAELSLNQEDLDLARASIEEFGGENTKKFNKRLKRAQKEHDRLERKRPRKPPKANMIIENPDSDFSVTTYYRESGLFIAYGPKFDQYSTADIQNIWGKPDEIITDYKQIQQHLKIEYNEENEPITYEGKVLRENLLKGKMTWREIRAFLVINQDCAAANYSKLFVYEKQGKPNVYFEKDHVDYVTPVLEYISFTRQPEKYPRIGLGNYPDDFPKNYGSDGFYHEK